MQYIVEGDNSYQGDIVENILKRRGVNDIDKFLNLDESVLESPNDYANIDKGFKLLEQHILTNSSIHIIIDTDVDGITSAALMYLYLKDLEKEYKTDIKITYHMNKGKRHGIILEDKKLKLKDIDLLIVPDAGTNDVEQINICYKNNVDVLILDHHSLEDSNATKTDAVLINPHSSPNIHNKNISGVGVVYKFCKYIDEQLGVNYTDTYLDLVALGNIADIIDLRELETRYLVLQGLSNVQNSFIREIIEKQEYVMNGNTNITTIGWNVAPMLNATIRIGKPKERMDMFEALIGVEREIEYKTKDRVEIQSLQKSMARICGNVKSRQDRAVKQSVKEIEAKIKENAIDKNKVLLVDVTGILDNSFTGLVANKLTDKYKRPVILLQQRKSDNMLYGGSARGYENFIITDFKTYLDNTGLFEYCAGHDNAFGVEIQKQNINKLIQYINEDLKDVEITDYYTVDFEIPFNKLNKSIIKEVGLTKDIWGNKIDEPLFAITDVRINSRDIELRGERAKTLAFKKGDIDFYKRFTNEEYFNGFTLKPKKGFNVGRDLNYNIIGKLKYEAWEDRYYPKVEIIDYQVEEYKIRF